MRNLILQLHKTAFGTKHANRYLQRKPLRYTLRWLLCGLCDRLIMLILLFDQLLNRYPKPLTDNNGIIVSLTSFPRRIRHVWMTIDSIFRQSMRPEKVVLFLAKDEFPQEKNNLPKRLLGYERLGLKIIFTNQNLKPHNKYFFALQKYENKIIITADDDNYYQPNLISNLMRIHKKYPHCVCANAVRQIKRENGKFLPYRAWNTVIAPTNPSQSLVANGFNGVLYPTKLFKNAPDLFNTTLIRQLAPNADDLWLKANEIKLGIPVANGDYVCPGLNIPGSQAVSLQKSNLGSQNKNDLQWEQLDKFFHLNEILK